jgi:hypothetical protein
MAVVKYVYIAVNWDIRPFSLVYGYHHFGERTDSVYPEDCVYHFVLMKHWYPPSRLQYYSKTSIRKHISKNVRGGVINYTCQMYVSVIKLKGLQWFDHVHRPSVLSLVNCVQHMFTHSRVV